MTAKALCVGINEFVNLGRGSWLRGCVNDADDIAEMLCKKLDFDAADVTILRDSEATKANVMAELTKLVNDPDADHLIFTFSSHGTQVPNTDSDAEVDGVDEAFACYDINDKGGDWDRATVIVDDEFRELFTNVRDDVLLEVVLDTCHSGDGLRKLDLTPGRRPRFLPPPTAEGVRKLQNKPNTKRLRDAVSELPADTRPVLFAACKSEQTSADAHFGGRANGAFTYHFLKTLGQDAAQSRSDILAAVRKVLAKEDFEQIPQLESAPKAKAVSFGLRW
jgi:metacaspase-1